MKFVSLKKVFSISILSLVAAVCHSQDNLLQQDTLSKYILTPKESPQPKINGPKVFGVRPDHAILFTIAATGTRPMTFSADHLPKGVSVDSKNGKISGSVSKPGEYI